MKPADLNFCGDRLTRCRSLHVPTESDAKAMASRRYLTISLSALKGIALTTLRAGFALKTCSCLVKGLMPLRAGVAGLSGLRRFRPVHSSPTD